MEKVDLAKAYDNRAHRRANSAPADWKIAQREAFVSLLRQANKKSILEIGAGAGTDSLYFKECGLEVTCIDLSNENIRYCKEKGLAAQVMDFYELAFEDNAFEALYALNCLLHVPKADIHQVLEEVKRVVQPGGLFYMGLYGGHDSEGIWEEDSYEPKRYFASYSDESLRALVGEHFKEVYFKAIPINSSLHFQSLILEKIS